MDFIEVLFSVLFMFIVEVYCWRFLIRNKIEKYDFKRTFIIFILLIILIFCTYSLPDSVRMFVAFFILTTINYILNRLTIFETFSSTFIVQIILICSELIFAIFFSIVLKITPDKLFDKTAMSFLSNIAIGIIAIVLVRKSFFQKLYNSLCIKLNAAKKKNLIVLFIMFLMLVEFLLTIVYIKTNIFFIMVSNVFVGSIFIFLIYKIIEQYKSNELIKYDYDSLLDKAVDYETIIDSQRMENHENKNDLYILRNMIPKRNKEAHAQLDDMIKDYEKHEKKYKDDKDLYFQTLRIPSGGLRGLIYQKSLYMKNNNINYSIRIDRKINSKSLDKVSRETLRNLGKIVGVYLDNAIQEVDKLDVKQVGIEIYKTGRYFNISVANNIGLKLEIDDINKTGYSTKGGKHGYGLSLVNELLAKDKNITSETSITSNIFRQNIKIKM